MKRFARRLLGKLLPEFIKMRYRNRLFGFRPTDAAFSLSFVQTSERLTAVIGDLFRLRITEEEQSDLRYELVENSSCVEEMTGFFAAAKDKHLLFDVGSYKGFFSLFFCMLGPEKKAIAYEPSGLLMERARQLGAMNGVNDRIYFEEKAIGETSGSGRFEVGAVGFANRVEDSADGPGVQTTMASIDEECERLGLWPDLLKIDIEGYEWEALQGARKLLSAHRPVVFLEMHMDILEGRQIRPKIITDYLVGLGYQFQTSRGEPLKAREVYDCVESVYRCVAHWAGVPLSRNNPLPGFGDSTDSNTPR